jgi:Glycosyltransferase like family 2
MKTITLPVHNRVNYLKEMLDSLSKCRNLEEYTLLFSCEPNSDSCVAAVNEFRHPNKVIHLNTSNKGVRRNPYDLLQLAFHVYKSDINIHIEEDVVMSPDCLQLTDWFLEQDSKYGVLNFFNRNNKFNADYEKINEYQITKTQHNFTPFIWSMKPHRWLEFEKVWWVSELGWDYSVVDYMQNANWVNLYPECTRANHIGEYGTYMDPVLFAEHYAWRQYARVLPSKLSYII